MIDTAESLNGSEHTPHGKRLTVLDEHNHEFPPPPSMDPALKWVLGIIAALISSGCVLWLTNVNNSINELTKTGAAHGEKIAEIQGALPHVVKQLERIEHKIDRAIAANKKETE